jgi:membrane-bound lytic murein transglycosylase D
MTPQPTAKAPAPVLHVHLPDGRVFRFSTPFNIGRDHDCDVRVNDVHVSRKHVAVTFEKSAWCLRDLKSANGIFVDGRRVETVPIAGSLSISLGADGPSLTFEIEGVGTAKRRTPLAQTVQQGGGETRMIASYEERYFGAKAANERVGGRTMMIRRAFENVQKKQQQRLWFAIGFAVLATLSAGSYAFYKHWQQKEQQVVAEELFYQMKALDVDLARLEQRLAPTDAEGRKQLRSNLARRRELETTYDRFLTVLNLYDQKLSEEDRLILRITRLFGECELAAPEDYLKEVKTYIRRWQSSQRFERGVKLAQSMGYVKPITDELLAQNLPPQYFYLALQESDFNPFISGPPTRWGIAKGMWQFIPETGARYGLSIGPLAKMPTPDPLDDRQQWQKATRAAARYIKDIYATDAQASGLLVIASYNWGEQRIIDILKKMPDNPQERNLWKVLEKHRMPDQTYNYVFSILSAAVIGENPRLFGFDFDNPLAFVETKATETEATETEATEDTGQDQRGGTKARS